MNTSKNKELLEQLAEKDKLIEELTRKYLASASDIEQAHEFALSLETARMNVTLAKRVANLSIQLGRMRTAIEKVLPVLPSFMGDSASPENPCLRTLVSEVLDEPTPELYEHFQKVVSEMRIIASGILRDGSVVDGSVAMAAEVCLSELDKACSCSGLNR